MKRIYEQPEMEDGLRILVDRLWPRGMTKAAAQLDDWLKEVAPSHALRRWSGHDPARWEEFQKRYSAELDGKPDAWQAILDHARSGDVTLLYAARDAEHNNAVALKRYLEQRAKPSGRIRKTRTTP